MSTVCMSDYCINQILVIIFFFFSSGKIIYEKKGKQRTMQGADKQKAGFPFSTAMLFPIN